jgi:acyl-CoA synthetase (AMP-forming)/AMP-acid ligase II
MAITSLEHSILSALHRLRAADPRRRLFTFVDDRGRDQETITVAELADSAESVAESLLGWGFEPGNRAVLVYPPGPDFVRALLGCLIAGVVPVPVYPPDPLRLKSDLVGFAAVVASCEPRGVLTNSAYDRAKTLGAVGGFFDRAAPGWPRVRWHRTDRGQARSRGPVDWHRPASLDEPALLQYTSGSTASPKGVVITHGNLVGELRANAADLGLGDDVRGVFWLPQYHDFGLISVILSTATGNAHSYLLSPLTFLKRPATWFEVMSRVRATHTAAPNFAFDVAVRRTTPEQRADWDLGSIRSFMSAAEPIRSSTVDNFFAAFAVTGLRRAAFYPAYGLAEHTVSVAMGGTAVLDVSASALESGLVRPVDAAHRGPVATFLGCGRVTKPDAEVRIVDPVTRRACAADRVGEIWVRSSTKALGYLGLEEETAATFRATVEGEDDGAEYLRTGDLGFLHGGEVFVTGRHKDVIIVHGRNLHPEDLENAVRDSHPGIRPGGVAAFSVLGEDGERLVLFVETTGDGDRAEIAEAVRARLFGTHQLVCEDVVVGPKGLVRKTTSGKVRRRACRELFLKGV